MTIRHITLDDIDAYRHLRERIDPETEFFGAEPGERFPTRQDVVEQVEAIMTTPNSTIFLAEQHKKFIGFLSAESTKWKSLQRTVHIMIGILAEFHHQGIGTRLYREFEVWAYQQNIHRIEALVMGHNNASIGLAKKMGFEIEGIRRESSIINGQYIDEVWMAKILEN